MSNLHASLVVAAMIGTAVVGNVLMKVGAAGPKPVLGIVSWYSIAGLSLFALAAVCYMLVLQVFPLSVAQCLMAAQFIGVILAAAFVLAEPIAPLRWLGIALIAAGIVVVAMSVEGGAP